jgi:hypothetical protein
MGFGIFCFGRMGLLKHYYNIVVQICFFIPACKNITIHKRLGLDSDYYANQQDIGFAMTFLDFIVPNEFSILNTKLTILS